MSAICAWRSLRYQIGSGHHRCVTKLIKRNCSNITKIVSSDNIDVTADANKGLFTVTMKNKPVNAFTMDMLLEMGDMLEELNATAECKAVVLTSSLPKIFCAGLDINELVKAKTDSTRFREYWNKLIDMTITLYGMRPVTVASINGAAPAGGCLLSLGCDHVIMAKGKHLIGLNEPQLGVDVPFWLTEMFYNRCGRGNAEQCLPFGQLLTVEEAHRIGLVHTVCELSDLEKITNDFVDRALKIPEAARFTTKMYIRHSSIKRFQEGRDIDTDHKVELFKKDHAQEHIRNYLDSLKKKN